MLAYRLDKGIVDKDSRSNSLHYYDTQIKSVKASKVSSKQAWRGERFPSYELSSRRYRELETHVVTIVLSCGWVRNAYLFDQGS